MDQDPNITVLVGLLLMLGNGFFVAAEYGLVGCRRVRIEAMAKKGNRAAKSVLAALDDMSTYIAGIQVGITIFSIALGALTEEPLTARLMHLMKWMPEPVVKFLSILVVAFPLVILGELMPKYLSLQYSEKAALLTIRPLRFCVSALKPIVWLTKKTGGFMLKPFKVDMESMAEQTVSREELALIVQASQTEGEFDESQAGFITRTLKLDALDAADIMVHRLDMHWLDIDTPAEGLAEKLAHMPHSRIPVCRGDIDDVVGVVYLQDILKALQQEEFSLESVMRPAEVVPENLTLDRIIGRMREAKTQILIVCDEYGGTSGLLTLEDVVEEIFGDLEDKLESERPPIERIGSMRVVARADVRYDELLDFLRIEHPSEELMTDTLATLVVTALERVPRLGDSVDLPIGKMRVENMARRRITRLAIILKQEFRTPPGT